MPDTSFKSFEQAGWSDASVCENYHRHLSQVTTQSVGALLDAAGVREASRVLDVATGAGYVAGAAGARGAVATGIDFSQAQVERARLGYPDAVFEQADAEALPFDDASFDAVVNAFGMCHLPDPALAMREAFRVLKPGGRFAFTVWDVPERAVGFGAIYGAIRAHGTVDVDLPAGPNFFLFSEAEYCLLALQQAGFVSPGASKVPQTWRLGSADDVYEALEIGSVRAAATLRAQSQAQRQAIQAAVRASIAQHRNQDAYMVPMPAALAWGTKP